MRLIVKRLAVDLSEDGWFDCYAHVYNDNTIEVFGCTKDGKKQKIVITDDTTGEIYPWVLGESLVKD